jgi:hypothetical protein
MPGYAAAWIWVTNFFERNFSMRHLNIIMALFLVWTCVAGAAPAREYRYIVVTDMTHDDGNSLIRLLHYANEIDIEAIIVSPQGPEAHKFSGWADQIWNKTHKIIDAYEAVYSKLIQHDPDYPTPGHIREITKRGKKTGAPMRMTSSGDDGKERFHDYIGDGQDSDGSRFLQEVFERDDPRPIFAAFWGGPWTFTQAVYRYRQTHTNAEVQSLMDKMIFHCIHLQDVTFDYFVDLDAFGGKFYGDFGGERMVPSKMLVDLGNFWSYIGAVNSSSVQSNGADLGALYDGGGEGDTPSFLNLISMNLGLSDVSQPDWGGWGDMYRRHGTLKNVWQTFDKNELQKYIPEATNNFIARLNWEKKDYGNANHTPAPMVNESSGADVIYIKKSAGAHVELDAGGTTDPDGDQVRYSWYQHGKADSYAGTVSIQGGTSAKASLTVPSDIGDKSIHVILEISDNATPSLTAYRRIIIGPNVEAPHATATAITLDKANRTSPSIVQFDGASSPGAAVLSNPRLGFDKLVHEAHRAVFDVRGRHIPMQHDCPFVQTNAMYITTFTHGRTEMQKVFIVK